MFSLSCAPLVSFLFYVIKDIVGKGNRSSQSLELQNPSSKILLEEQIGIWVSKQKVI